MMAAVLWYTPAARFSNSDATITARYFFASLQNASVDGPGMLSASAKKRWSSTLAEILRAEQLLRADDLRALLQGAFGQHQLLREVLLRVIATRHLREAHFTSSTRPWSIKHDELRSG